MIWILVLAAVFFGLYQLGWLPVSTKRAAMYVGSGGWGKQAVGASFTRCAGSIRRVVRFRESRSYSFHLTGHIQQGTVSVQIRNRQGQVLLNLTPEQPSGFIAARKGDGYTLIIRFQNASGDYQLDWT